MRALVIAGLMAIGFGLVGVSASSAAPARGSVIVNAAQTANVVEQARWRRHHHRHRHHCWWSRGYIRCW